MEEDKRARCYNCKFFLCKDSGYSDYTVEGTDIVCLKRHFDWVDESYSWRPQVHNSTEHHEFFKRAENCQDFKEGEHVSFSVESDIQPEEWHDDEQKQAIIEFIK